MKKLKIFSLGNDGTYNHFEIEKKQSFVNSFKEFLSDLDENFSLDYVLADVEMDPETHDKTVTNMQLKDAADYYEHISGGKRYKIDLYIRETILLVVYCSLKDREHLMKQLMKFCEIYRK